MKEATCRSAQEARSAREVEAAGWDAGKARGRSEGLVDS